MNYDETCRICSAAKWTPLYHGPIRAGKPGQFSAQPANVYQCDDCGAGFLPGESVDYEGAEYRERVSENTKPERYREIHDREQGPKLKLLGSEKLRNKVIADVGCGAGSFLDLVGGMASQTVAIEPTVDYHDALRLKGHAVFNYTSAALLDWRAGVDLAVSFSVIEHIEHPLEFLREIRSLLKKGGRLLLSTPNRDDWMLDLLPEEYGAFFYRQVHRWYFDAASVRRLGELAGFSETTLVYHHRFDLSNALLWLRDRVLR